MPKRFIKTIWRDEKGITGLETAIILIAFVVVAAVFAYTVLSAGLFSTQKSSEAVYSGLKEAQSSMELRGGVIAYKGDANISSSVGKVEFTVSNALKNGQVVDLTPPYTLSGGAPTSSGLTNPSTIAYNDQAVTIANTAWTLSWVGKHSDDYLLEESEKAVITVWLHNYNGSAWSNGSSPPFLGSNYVDTYHTFTLEVKTPSGAVLTVERTMPAIIRDVNNLN
jgi:flagellin FlaB